MWLNIFYYTFVTVEKFDLATIRLVLGEGAGDGSGVWLVNLNTIVSTHRGGGKGVKGKVIDLKKGEKSKHICMHTTHTHTHTHTHTIFYQQIRAMELNSSCQTIFSEK